MLYRRLLLLKTCCHGGAACRFLNLLFTVALKHRVLREPLLFGVMASGTLPLPRCHHFCAHLRALPYLLALLHALRSAARTLNASPASACRCTRALCTQRTAATPRRAHINACLLCLRCTLLRMRYAHLSFPRISHLLTLLVPHYRCLLRINAHRRASVTARTGRGAHLRTRTLAQRAKKNGDGEIATAGGNGIGGRTVSGVG